MSRAIQKASDFIADFENLFVWYIDRASVEVAWRFQAALDISLVKLTIQPGLGRPRHFRHPDLWGLRSFAIQQPFEKVLIFYRATDAIVYAVRLMHGARNLPRRLRQASSGS